MIKFSKESKFIYLYIFKCEFKSFQILQKIINRFHFAPKKKDFRIHKFFSHAKFLKNREKIKSGTANAIIITKYLPKYLKKKITKSRKKFAIFDVLRILHQEELNLTRRSNPPKKFRIWEIKIKFELSFKDLKTFFVDFKSKFGGSTQKTKTAKIPQIQFFSNYFPKVLTKKKKHFKNMRQIKKNLKISKTFVKFQEHS